MELEKKLKRMGSAQLLKKLDKTPNAIEKSAIRKILADRGVEVEKPPKENPKPKDAPEVNTKHPNVGKVCAFIPFRQSIEIVGMIKAHVHDRRVSRKYYRIQGKNGKIYHKKTDSTQLTIIG